MIDIDKLSDEAKIQIKDEELEYIHNQINKEVKTLTNLTKLEIEEPIYREYTTTFREDIKEESLTVEEALKNTENKKYSYFEVETTVEEEY